MKVIRVENLKFAYNGLNVLENVSLEIERGEFVAVLGPNGAGKSTLLKCIAGLLRCEGIEILGKPLEHYSRRDLARIIGCVPQSVNPGFMRVFDIVLLGRKPYMGFKPSGKDIKIVNETLKKLGIQHLALKPANRLSGGELQKVSIARALAQEPEILLMDEPTNNLDPKSQLEVMKIAKEFAKAGKVSIAVMHDVNLALRFADRFIFMRNGKIIADGKEEILKPEIFEKVYEIKGFVGKLSGIPVFIADPRS
ncbi:ATP-binding cassette domain-containing protein [Thermococcus sp. 101 C5]|uniref:ABC transporter ATP-binding protein n=1 Tax=Thermococcus sp. 101 C5 TaxID=2654197 RepID=UPI00128DACEE|nr:ABC transporter ATP-binding protein [Thermococcus sp. 101 C5]MPW39035.1 ATP-binding cassette domain-containing protein [Thermococcus sp. 101 C5]